MKFAYLRIYYDIYGIYLFSPDNVIVETVIKMMQEIIPDLKITNKPLNTCVIVKKLRGRDQEVFHIVFNKLLHANWEPFSITTVHYGGSGISFEDSLGRYEAVHLRKILD